MNNTELNKNLLVCLLIFMFAGAFIIGSGLSLLGGDHREGRDVLPAYGLKNEGESVVCLAEAGQVYDPVENAEEQILMAEQIKKKGCIVVLNEKCKSKSHPVQNMSEAGSKNTYYLLSLSDEQQDKVYTLCDEFDLPAELAFGIITADLQRTDMTSYEDAPHSILHPNIDSAAWYMEHYGLTDMNDFDQNARLGIIMLSEYYHRYPDVNKIAMCYELGETKAIDLWESGTIETEYSVLVAHCINTLVPRGNSPS